MLADGALQDRLGSLVRDAALAATPPYLLLFRKDLLGLKVRDQAGVALLVLLLDLGEGLEEERDVREPLFPGGLPRSTMSQAADARQRQTWRLDRTRR